MVPSRRGFITPMIMTVQELYNWCKAYRNKNAKVYVILDETVCDENGYFADLHPVEEVVDQEILVETNFDFKRIHEAILKIKPPC